MLLGVWVGSWEQWAFGGAEALVAFCLTRMLTRPRRHRTNYESRRESPYTTVGGAAVHKNDLPGQVQSVMDNLFGIPRPVESPFGALMHTIQDMYLAGGVITPSECRELVPLSATQAMQDLGWWYKTCLRCSGTLICTTDHPEPGCICEREATPEWTAFASASAQAAALVDTWTWRAMNTVPPHMIGHQQPIIEIAPHLIGNFIAKGVQ